MSATLDAGIERAAALIREARYTIALVGAGMSKESGIPTFRGEDGLWTRLGEPGMMGYQAFIDDPKGWWERRQQPGPGMAELAEALAIARPNPGHVAMAELERHGYLKHTITQNIDNLHYEAGSRAVTEIHGNRHKLRCLHCNERYWAEGFDMTTLPPRCPQCDGLVKGDTVMFGEPIPADALARCAAEAAAADCVIVAGTSAVVYPAAEFPIRVVRRGGILIEVNPDDTPLSELAAVVLRGPSGEVLPRLAAALIGDRNGGAVSVP